MLRRVMAGVAFGLLVATNAFAEAPLAWTYSDASSQGVGISGGLTGVMQGSPYLRFAVMELAYGTDLGGGMSSWSYKRLSDALTPEGSPSIYGYDYGEGYGYRIASQLYRHKDDTSKTVEIRVSAEYLPWGADWAAHNGPAVRVTAYAEWVNGVPAALAGSNKLLGLVMRSDHDVSGSNSQGTELALGVNKALSASLKASGMNSTHLQWAGIPNQPLARFFDTYERAVASSGGSVFDLYFLANDAANETYSVDVRRYSEDTNSFQSPPNETPAQTAIDPSFDYYTNRVEPGGGSDQVAYLMTQRKNPSASGYEWMEVETLLVKRDGYRGIDLQWFHHHPEHGEPDYVADDGQSVRSVLESLHDSSPVYIRTQQTELTCPGNDCQEAELIDLQYLHNYDYGQDKSVLKTAVYVVRNDQTAAFGGVVYGNRSHGFVIPKMLGNSNKTAVYAAILHELGHTFKFQHSWSRCASSNNCGTTPYCCENGDLMSYSHALALSSGWSHYDFNFNADSKRWFREAPLPYVEPFVGGSPGASESTNPDLEPGQVLGW
jgi:hypothetical protein